MSPFIQIFCLLAFVDNKHFLSTEIDTQYDLIISIHLRPFVEFLFILARGCIFGFVISWNALR